ncbi:MAG TPA: VWA domain-containing protein [Verrucomicrobiae bacterium]|nr:VWA domain-containing protein [Verrucomicrobiae bacterium]
MQFADRNILALLLVFPPALIAFYWWSWRKRQVLMTQFIQARLLPGLVAGISTTRQKLKLACLVLSIVCLIVALARPQWGFTWEEVKVRGVDIVVAIDTSKSMLAADIAPNRLERAKLAALDLMQLAKADRLGLVAFAGSAFLQCPLTIDDTAFRQSVEALNVNIIPEGGTALGEAIDTAQTAFKEGDNHRILILMSDGEDQDTGALEAARKAGEAGMRIYTIGIGTAEGELLPIKDAQGHDDYIRDEQGNVVKSHLNERLLQQIASATPEGFYLPLRGAKTMDTLYAEGLAKLPKSEHQQKLVKNYEERYYWPLGFAILLLIIEMLIPERKREPKPAPSAGTVRGASWQAAAVIALFALAVPAALGSPSSALREYKTGKYDQALKEYERLLEKNSDDPRLHFNAGTAAYRDQKFDEAARQFNAAIATPDLKLQELAYYNRANAQYWLGEKNSDPNKRTDAWQKALQDYESSMKLNPQDADAKFNRDFVKKRLEQLKEQQQQQKNSQQNKSDQQQNQDQNQQQQQNEQSKQDQKDQQQQQQQQQAQDKGQQNQSQQQNASQQNEQKKQDQQQQQAAQQNQQQQKQQPSRAAEEQKNQSGETNQQQYAAGEMTPDQARQLLDSQKGDEKMLPIKPEGERRKRLKDW